jgi:hypothetical protein
MPQPPKWDAARANAKVGPVVLPLEGRSGEPPMWPVPATLPTNEEWAMWDLLWRSPQAVMWARMGPATCLVVARYCSLLVRCQSPRSSSVIHGQVGMLEDKLGLTPKAMRSLLWELAEPPKTEARKERSGARGRIKAVDKPTT